MRTTFLIFANLSALLLAIYTFYLIVRVRLYIGYGVAWLLLLGLGVFTLNFPPAWGLLRWVTGTQDAQQAWADMILAGIVFLLIYLFVQMTILSQRITAIARHIALGQLRENQEEKASEEDRDTE
tara:strand:+ start:136 stop:510 length:375 start_codon:yes stop_codon:yes gene_type:complete